MDSEDEFDDTNIDEAVAIAMRDLPRPVRDFLASDARDEISRDLTKKYALRVDQAGEMERALALMLLGVMSPDEFVQTLSDTGLQRSTIQELAAEVNSRVFIPLRLAQTGEQSFIAPAPAKAEIISTPSLPYQSPEPVQQTAPIPVTAAPAPITPSVPTPTPVMHGAFSAPPQPATQPPTPLGWQPAAAVHIYAPSFAAPYMPVTYQQPQQAAQPEAVVVAVPTPVTQPTAYTIPQQIAPTFQPPEPTSPAFSTPQHAPQTIPTPPITPTALSVPSFNTPEPFAIASAPDVTTPANPLAREYSADPYREPV